MKVLMIGNDPSVKGGITSVISQLLAHDWNFDGVDMKFIPSYVEASATKKMLFFAGAYRKIEKCLREWRPDVVHIHMSYRGSFTRKYLIHQLCKKCDVSDIIHLHGSEFEKWYLESNEKKREQIRSLLRECNAFIVLGDKWNATIKSIEPETKTVVVSNTVAIPETTAKWNKSLFEVLFLGVLIQRKGVADLLRAIRKLKDIGKTEHMKFTIAGSGIEEASLKMLGDELKVSDIVEFAGWIDGNKKRDLLQSSQLLVLPSYNEGLPMAILEAISYGLPVVATDVGDISSAVRDGQNGYLIHPGDIDGLAAAITKVVENKEWYEILSRKSRQLAEENFSDKIYFEKIKTCYREAIIMQNRENLKYMGGKT